MEKEPVPELLTFTLILIMSAYALFEQTTSKYAITMDEQVQRHERLMDANSEFYNPWQYRVFSAWLMEGLFRGLVPATSPYVPFLLLRFVQHVLLFYLSYYFYRALGVANPLLRLTGLLILCFTIGNSSFHSDLSFNTYFDVIFYLMAALLVLKEKYIWIIPLTCVAALNRETSALIPFLALTPVSRKSLTWPRLAVTGWSILVFACVFVAIRWYYGYQEAVSIHGMTTPLEFLKYNLTFGRFYALAFGTLGFLPVLVGMYLKKLPLVLIHWFWIIVPLWMFIHAIKALVVETRLFLVPHALIFVPAFLILVEYWYTTHRSEPPAKKEPIA